MDTLLISLHPRHAQNVFEKKKSIELRKKEVRTKIEDADTPLGYARRLTFNRVLIYETLPVASIIGYCEVVDVQVRAAEYWVKNHQESLCLTAKEIYDYLGDRAGYGIKLRKPQRIAPIPLEVMRSHGINPPQSYQYLTTEQIKQLGISFSC